MRFISPLKFADLFHTSLATHLTLWLQVATHSAYSYFISEHNNLNLNASLNPRNVLPRRLRTYFYKIHILQVYQYYEDHQFDFPLYSADALFHDIRLTL
jgi:hypothetical protein